MRQEHLPRQEGLAIPEQLLDRSHAAGRLSPLCLSSLQGKSYDYVKQNLTPAEKLITK